MHISLEASEGDHDFEFLRRDSEKTAGWLGSVRALGAGKTPGVAHPQPSAFLLSQLQDAAERAPGAGVN